MAIPEDVTFRTAGVPDAQFMWEIDQACFEPDVAYTPDIFYYHLLVTEDAAFVAESGGEVVGFVMTAIGGSGRGIIVTIDVLPKWRKKGIGTRLMSLAEDELRRRACRTVELEVSVDNKRAGRFYERLGYVKKRLLRDYYGKGRDAIMMNKSITS